MEECIKHKAQTMQEHPSAKAGFTKIYADGNAPWEIEKPQPPFIEVADQVMSPVLDCGCGTGNTSLFFAARGLQVTGIDFVEVAIQRAQEKAAERALRAEFLVMDAMTLGDWDKRFASVIDSGLFHIYHGEELYHYVKGLAHIIKPGGKLFLFSFSDKMETLGVGGLSEQELYKTFANGWAFESLQLVRGEINQVFLAENPDWDPAKGDPKMWFVVIRRKE